ncbi:MAG: L,D-transpeptidase family protein [Candidatus Omnitrophica bacterium]|nr:L,D-transpeptidase family protein [Candidatus Omnitrophota bacterium]
MTRRWQVVAMVVLFLAGGLGLNFVLGKRGPGRGLFLGGLQRQAKEAFSKGKLDEALQVYTQMTAEDAPPDLKDEGYFGIGAVQSEKKNFLEAKRSYEKIIHEFPNSNMAPLVQEELGKVNMAILFSPAVTPMDKTVQVQSGDSLAKIAKSHGTTVELLVRANQLKSDLIRPGMKLKVPATRFSVVVDKSQNTLALKAGEEIFKVYPVATGENNSTPVGTFKIVNKLVNPVWYTLGAVVPSDSPENVLGTRWLGINEPGYGIHGTREPESIGKQGTKGCVRMFNQDVEELYAIVPIGTEVTIID